MVRRSLALLLAGCGAVHFTEPNPPALFRSTAKYVSTSVAEPVVWLPVLDLFAENSASCDAARAWTLQAIRDAMSAQSAARMELAGADLSPQCTQAPDRTLDEPAMEAQIRSAVAAFPSAHVRAIVVYANNIALPAPDQVAAALARLRLNALLWTLARAPVSTQVAADESLQWTFAQDDALAQSLAALAVKDLPLQSDASGGAALPILGRDDLPRARFVKFCNEDGTLTLLNLPGDGSTSPVTQSKPPMFQVQFTPRYALPRGSLRPVTASVEVEGCSANCSRYVTAQNGGMLREWDTTRGCLLGAP